MRLSKFTELLNDEFGVSHGQILINDLVLTELADRTANAALKDGEDPKRVWLALCLAAGVPKERWHGISKKPTRQD